MAETPPQQRNLSLVPYLPAESGQIVLRHGSAVVVFDTLSKQLSLRDASHTDAVELTACPYCHRSLRPDDAVQEEDSHDARHNTPAPGFVNPEYFRMLQSSAPGSVVSSRPPSPLKRLVQPVEEDCSRSPPGEFIGSAPAPTFGSEPQHISSNAFSQGYFKTFFVEEKELGRGGKGVVLLVKHILDGVSLGHFACKRVPVGDDHEWLRKVLVEVQVLQNLSHQNLVSYRHIWLEDYQLTTFGPSVPCAFILQQYCNAGDLHKFILGNVKTSFTPHELKERLRRKSKGQLDPMEWGSPRRLSFQEILAFTKDITSGLNHLHTNRYIHRDLKPSNCLLQQDGTSFRVLLSDFGEVQTENLNRKSTGSTGTISYCAPEVLRRDPVTGALGNFTLKSDIFSLGMIVHFMCFGRLPYRNSDSIDEDNEDIDLLRAEIMDWAGFDDERRANNGLPDMLYKTLKRLLSIEPNDRPKATEILNLFGRGFVDDNGDFQDTTNFFEETDARIRPIDTSSPGPSRRPSVRNLKPGTLPNFARPGPSKLRQTALGPSRSPSPTESTSSGLQSDEVPSDLALSVRRANSELLSRPKLSPRLMLPAPPTLASRLNGFFEAPRIVLCLKTGLFLGKAMSTISPCTTTSPNPWIVYPLLILAALDFAIVEQRGELAFFRINTSMLLLVVHVSFLLLAKNSSLLCAGRTTHWMESDTFCGPDAVS